jgi:hypothetical protein
MTSGFVGWTMITSFFSTTWVSTFCLSFDVSAPLSFAFFRMT